MIGKFGEAAQVVPRRRRSAISAAREDIWLLRRFAVGLAVTFANL
jgi:hypothetical protein